MNVKQYRKNPVVIEAILYTGENKAEIYEWMSKTPDELETKTAGFELWIETFEGTIYGSAGDYIIKGVAGEFYPCKPEIFFETYTQVTDLQPSKEEPDAKK